jgi:uncharacterized membrane protein
MKLFMEQVSAWISSTALSQYILDQRWIFPGFEILHFIGMAMLVGFALTLDRKRQHVPRLAWRQ